MAARILVDGFWTLEDIICEGLDVLFVGYNPNLLAVERQHYYARKGNRFWEDLHTSGLVPAVFRGMHEDRRILDCGLGLTDVIKRPSPNTDTLSEYEFRTGFRRLADLVRRYEPRIVCFNGNGIFDWYRKLGGDLPAEVRAIPSSSPRNNGQHQRRLEALAALKARVDSRARPLSG